ncbi:MAG: hypothetical protein LBP99_09115 [Azoarcus sp.]|jgi:hypothetical protein|nr:hypothetical protein [Azoarcus sp.]
MPVVEPELALLEVERESLTSLAGLRGLPTQKVPLRERLAALTQEVDAIPPRTNVELQPFVCFDLRTRATLTE